MKVLIQRTHRACVTVNDEVKGEITRGLLLFIGIDKHDDAAILQKMATKVLSYRVFADKAGKMNLNVQDVAAEILAISQFTLSADTQKGLRPSFSKAAAPNEAKKLYEQFVDLLRKSTTRIACGEFGADMQVSLCNDGPVTFLLEM